MNELRKKKWKFCTEHTFKCILFVTKSTHHCSRPKYITLTIMRHRVFFARALFCFPDLKYSTRISISHMLTHIIHKTVCSFGLKSFWGQSIFTELETVSHIMCVWMTVYLLECNTQKRGATGRMSERISFMLSIEKRNWFEEIQRATSCSLKQTQHQQSTFDEFLRFTIGKTASVHSFAAAFSYIYV